MKQKQKNIRLLTLLGILIAANAVVILLSSGSDDGLDVPRDLFSYESTETIDRVIIGPDTLTYDGINWVVNGKYKADPQRVEVLFAIAKQVKVRRKASQAQLDSLNQLLGEKGVSVVLFSEGELVKSYKVWGDAARGMTWLREDGGDIPYLVEIPGYRSYLGGIFELDQNGWRYPIVLDINWQNLQSVSVEYPERENASFDVVFRDGNYVVDELDRTDSLRLTDFLDDLSLLYVNDFLFAEEVEAFDSLYQDQEAHIVVKDVGQNNYVVDIFSQVPGTNEILVRIDSAETGLADYGKVRKLLKPRGFFKKQ